MSTTFEEAVLRNYMLLEGLCLGLYTVCYVGTVYVYWTRKSSRSWLVLGCISLLYFCYMIQTASSVVSSQSDGEIRMRARSYLAYMLANYLLSSVADVLLTWRCFHVWGRSLLTASSAAFLLFGESVYVVVLVVNTAGDFANPIDFPSDHLNSLVTIGLFITFGVTMILTLLIAYRIHSACKEQIRPGTKGVLKHILEIVLQSAALHVMVAFITGVTLIIPFPEQNYKPWYSVQNYMSAIFPFTAGLAPTIMVARISFMSQENTLHSVVSPPVSALQFQAFSHSAGGLESVGSTAAPQAQSYSPPGVQTEKR
ncbi:hypothetical protein CVT26_005473 [Gymnopilus dilepis]|uniref:THH1/TOM1/TOM3 domain-containing protein n=1 Tax=Gymnopilus dilepis TaxID=231916 RepID=A0A409YT79_9AGAR|nr:hypothetical protein CVT26_005473 [Gymnopilus dilepis]